MSYINKKFLLTILVDFMPVLVFIVFFELFNFMDATTAIIVATIISFIVATIKEKRIPILMFCMAILTLTFGYATLAFESSNILKLKDTFYDFASGTVLIFSFLIFKRLIAKDFFKHVLFYKDEGWIWLTYAWTFYFYAGGIVNEFIRHIPGARGDEFWVYFKIIHIPVTILWSIATIYYANKKYSLPTTEYSSTPESSIISETSL